MSKKLNIKDLKKEILKDAAKQISKDGCELSVQNVIQNSQRMAEKTHARNVEAA